MGAYFGYLALAGVQIPLCYKKDKLGNLKFNSRLYVLLCCLELILLAGLRGYTVGADTAVYLDAIDYYGSLPFIDRLFASLVFPFDFEVGYFFLTKLCTFLFIGKSGFLFIVAILTYVPVFAAIYKHSSVPYISIVSYFAFGMFSYSLGVFRQMIAISILLCGWKYIVERRFFKYLLVVLLAMLFHSTAVIALCLYVLYGIKWRRVILLLIPCELVLLFCGRYVVALAVKLLPQYAHYIGGKFDQQGGSYLMLLLLNVVLFIAVIMSKRGRFKDDVVVCALILAVLLQAVGYSMALFGRVVPYFSIYLLFAIPDIVYGMGKNWRKPAGVVAVAVLLFLAYRLISSNQYITPYYLFFQNIPIK